MVLKIVIFYAGNQAIMGYSTIICGPTNKDRKDRNVEKHGKTKPKASWTNVSHCSRVKSSTLSTLAQMATIHNMADG